METTGTTLTRDVQQYRRFTAWKMWQEGYSQPEIARALCVTQGAVSQWVTKAQRDGEQALKQRKAPGATPKLTKEQLAKLPTLLEQGPCYFGFAGQVWTCARVGQVIYQEFGVRYHDAHISRLLNKIGWSLQKPIKRALQRDEAAIARWKRERYPALKRGHSEASTP